MGSQGLIYSAGARRSSDLDRGVVIARATPTQQTVVGLTGQRMISASGRLNQQVAERLREAAELLERQQASPFRVGAYRRAAETVAGLDEDAATLSEREGIQGLDALAGIGPVLAQAIAQMVRTGH